MKLDLYKKIGKRFLTLGLILAIIAPTVFAIIPPKKAQADSSSCLAGFAAAFGITITAEATTAATAVPVSDNGKIESAATQSGGSKADLIKDCIEKPLAYALARMLLDQMTNELVSWINGGFNGSPAFVTDPGQFLMNIGDQVAGDFILGSDWSFLCSPFQVQIQLALSLNYNSGSSYSQQASCTLSSVFNNIDNAFSDFSSGGWAGWFAITQNSNNNPYGSFLNASNEMDLRINGQKAVQGAQLNWSGGFLSYTTCTPAGGGPDYTYVGGSGGVSVGNTTLSVNGPSAGDKCQISTPGRVIAGALDKQLGVATDELGVANDLDKIFNALGDQMMKQVFGATGLLGAGSSVDNGYTATLAKNSSTTAQRISDQTNANLKDVNQMNGNGSDTSQPTPVASNIAVNKEVTASSIVINNGVSYEPANIVDGNIKSNTGGDGGFTGAVTDVGTAANPAWLQINLGQVTKGIDKINVYQKTNPGENSSRGFNFSVQILDKDDTTILWESQTYPQDYSGLISIPVQDENGKAVDGQYVRLWGKNTGRLEIAEVQVFQNQAPVISLIGQSTISLTLGDQFIDPGYTAADTEDGDLTSLVQVSGLDQVDTNTLGTYPITYTVTDSGGTTSTTTRTVIVGQAYTTDITQ